MKNIGFIIVLILTLNSCASILNSSTTKVKISADKKSKIIFKNDTISIYKKQTAIKAERSKKPLKITVIKDSLQKDFYIKSKLSSTLLLNVYNYGAGLIVDLFSSKRFRYPSNLHFVTDSLSNNIVLSNKKITVLTKNTFFIYTYPIQLFDFFSIPMTTLGTEYFVKNNFSLSAEYGINYPKTKLRRHNITYLDEKAFTYRFETKWYNSINLTRNVHLNEYLGFEFREIRSQYNDYIDYTDKNTNQNNFIRDDFATKKRVTIFNLKYGILIPIGKQFYFDFYTGLGIRIKKFNHLNLEFDKTIHNLYDDDFPTFYFREFKNYNKKAFLNLSLGCKFGINF
ncbi:hypothetical protein H9I45_04035 [Polaribacter haliotis]|uniref:Outer membrane protein beta-barrel domain-containing protein n=1 Tax=Polaribacter haliotis TaxID=1888915 RepID=A0A7L8AI28_9FLAO|nr:hypothetical protein [Polaribacter haliotis]QOD61627.1 hypothetical protein H9I45_04035 [Polaribacter haliotis]